MQYKESLFAEARLHVGCVNGFNGGQFTRGNLIRVLQDFQKTWNDRHGWTMAVRVTDTTDVCVDMCEHGWEIISKNKPRQDRCIADMEEFFTSLQEHLMVEFGQKQIMATFDFHCDKDHLRRHVLAER